MQTGMAGSEQDVQTTLSPASLSQPQPKLRWLNLIASGQYIRKTGWEHRLVPSELSKLPKDIVITEKLQEIIAWSLTPGSNWSYQLPPNTEAQKQRTSCHGDLGKHWQVSTPNADDSSTKLNSSSIKSPSITSITSHSTITSPADPSKESLASENSLKIKFLSKIGLKRSNEDIVSTIIKAAPATVECTSCFEELPEKDMIRLKSCRHWYCKECLSTLIVTAMAAEASFPPKCCLSPIPLQQILKALSPQQREDYKLKASEYAVPMTDRWYCPNKDCLKWIPGSKLKINKELSYDCPHCAAKVCRTCRGSAHPVNTDCPQDFGLEATLETAEIEGWQRCYKCQALVELRAGCRHMTCRCNAHFCYVCGLKWQTCSCTETDAANKRAGVQRRRQERAAKVDAEAAEIARAIAEVEEMERLEAEERRLEEVRRQREEEEQLRRMEEERQTELMRRKEEAEQAERDLHRALISSFEEEQDQLYAMNHKILAFQRAEINSRHDAEDLKLSMMHLKDEDVANQEYESMRQGLTKNSTKRRLRLTKKQAADLEALELRQEEEEDDLFIQVQMRLKGKANKEARMERMLAEIRKQQEEEKKELGIKQELEADELEKNIAFDTDGLKKLCQTKIQEAKDKKTTALQKFGYTVGADRQYFEIVYERRAKLLALHQKKCLDSLKAGDEPTGLTEYEASKIQPSLPELDDGEPGPSGIPHGPKVVMTTHGPLKMERYYEQRKSFVQTENQATRLAPLPENDSYHPNEQRLDITRATISGPFPTDIYPILPPAPLAPKRRSLASPTHPPPPVPVSPQSPTPSPINTSPISVLSNNSLKVDSAPTLVLASIAASAALGAVSQIPRLPQPDTKSPTTTVTNIVNLSDESLNKYPTNPFLVSIKRSKWGFKKQDKMMEEEIRRRMRAAVGDAAYA